MPGVTWDTRVASLDADLRRVVDRLRTMAEGRLATGAPRSRADAARALAQTLADVATGAEADDSSPVWRQLPRLGDLAVGDQVAVTGQDAVAALGRLDAASRVPTRSGEVTAAAGLLSAAAAAVRGVRDVL